MEVVRVADLHVGVARGGGEDGDVVVCAGEHSGPVAVGGVVLATTMMFSP